MKSTNYYDTFIAVAEDCPAEVALVPPRRHGKKTTAYLQYALLIENPYKYTCDDIAFLVYAKKKGLPPKGRKAAREKFFARGPRCLRASPLTKRYGWGVHCNSDGKVALYGVETKEYKKLARDTRLNQIRALRAHRK